MKYLLIASMLIAASATAQQANYWITVDPNNKIYQANIRGAFIQINIDSTNKQRIYISGDTAAVVSHFSERTIYYMEERTLLYRLKNAALNLYHEEKLRGFISEKAYNRLIHIAIADFREADHNLFQFYKKHNGK
jgi:hypothetical protein